MKVVKYDQHGRKTVSYQKQRYILKDKSITNNIIQKTRKLKKYTKRDVKILKKQYENGQITLGDLTEQELKEYNELIEAEMQEKAQKELYVYNLLMTAK